LPAYEQVIYAVKKAIVSGQMSTGDRFPSVRSLSQELRINPNTAHKAVSALVDEKLLEVVSGVGTVVSGEHRPSKDELRELLGQDVEKVVVEAKRLSLDLKDVQQAVEQHWNRLTKE